MTLRRSLVLFGFLSFLMISCSEDATNAPTINTENVVVWNGPNTTFTKQAGSDPNDPAAQDRLSNNVWLTRANGGGQIFNIKSENQADKNNSPANTLWAEGDIDNYQNLTFAPFRSTVGSPKDVVGKNLVAYLPLDEIVLYVRFTSWSQGKAGAFSYERSTP